MDVYLIECLCFVCLINNMTYSDRQRLRQLSVVKNRCFVRPLLLSSAHKQSSKCDSTAMVQLDWRIKIKCVITPSPSQIIQATIGYRRVRLSASAASYIHPSSSRKLLSYAFCTVRDLRSGRRLFIWFRKNRMFERIVPTERLKKHYSG